MPSHDLHGRDHRPGQAVILGERGITQAAKQGDIVLCMSTIDPLAARRFSEQLAQKGGDDAGRAGQRGALTVRRLVPCR